MNVIAWIKTAMIRFMDALNELNDPFDLFDRPACPKESKKLRALEAEFYQDLTGNFWACDGCVLAHRFPLPAGSGLDTGDQAIWHGVYTAMIALRCHLSSGGEQGQIYAHLVAAAKGMKLHQRAHGEPMLRLIRGVSNDLKTWQDDASNDSATGHLLGFYFGWKFGPDTLRPVFADLAGGLAGELANHGHALVRADGAPTTYGALEQGWKTDPLRISLALAVYAAAATMTGIPAFSQVYSDLFKRYGALARYPKVRLWWFENQNDTHRAAIHLAILADVTAGKACLGYRRGLERIRDSVDKLGNVWVNALCAWGIGSTRLNDRDQALKVLSEFTLKDKQFNDGRDNSMPGLLDAIRRAIPSFRPVLWNGKWMANQPLPRHMVRAQDFFWQRNLRSLDPGSDGAPADSRLNGGDYLAAYWLSRLTGILSAND